MAPGGSAEVSLANVEDIVETVQILLTIGLVKLPERGIQRIGDVLARTILENGLDTRVEEKICVIVVILVLSVEVVSQIIEIVVIDTPDPEQILSIFGNVDIHLLTFQCLHLMHRTVSHPNCELAFQCDTD